MTMKKILAAVLCAIATQCVGQNYFGQVPPDSIPVKFAPDVVSRDGRYELFAVYSPDGKEFCFTVTDSLWSTFSIWHTAYDGKRWSEPRKLAFAKDGFSPVFSPDGKTLFYSSGTWKGRPGILWYCKRNGTEWAEPVKAKAPINLEKGSNDWGLSMAKDGTLLFTSDRPGTKGEFDLYLSEPVNNEYPNAVNIEGVNSSKWEYSAFVAPDKSYIIFSSDRAGSFGWDDLYITFRKKDNSWSDPVNLGPGINTIDAEYAPFVTSDGKYLIYSVWDKEGKWSDIYWVRIDRIIGKNRKEANEVQK